MNQANRDFETFLTKYKLTMDALTKSQFKKAHSHVVGTMNAFFDYAYELEGQERLKAMRFGKEIKALEKDFNLPVTSVEIIDSLKELILNGAGGLKCPVCGANLVTKIERMYDLEDNLVLHPKAHCSKCVFQITH